MTTKEDEKRQKQQIEEAERLRRKREERERITPDEWPGGGGTGDGGAHLKDRPSEPKKPGI